MCSSALLPSISWQLLALPQSKHHHENKHFELIEGIKAAVTAKLNSYNKGLPALLQKMARTINVFEVKGEEYVKKD